MPGSKLSDGWQLWEVKRKIFSSKDGKLKLGPWPVFDAEVQEAVCSVLRSGKPNQCGTQVNAFAQELQRMSVKFGVANTSGSVALELAMQALEIGAGDDVVVSPRTFIISAHAPFSAGPDLFLPTVEKTAI